MFLFREIDKKTVAKLYQYLHVSDYLYNLLYSTDHIQQIRNHAI